MKPLLPWAACQRVLNLLRKHGDFAELYLEDSRGTAVSLSDKKIEDVSSGVSAGFGIRLVKGEETRFAASDEVSEAAILEAAQRLLGKAPKKGSRPSASSPRRLASATLNINLDVPARRLLAADKLARGISSQITQVSASFSEKRKWIQIANTEGRKALGERIYGAFMLSAIASKNGRLQTGREVIGGTSQNPRSYLQAGLVEDVAKIATNRALNLLNVAKLAPTGEMPIVLSFSAGGTMIHEAIGHSLEADSVQKGISPVYKGKLGQVVAHESVTVVDDPTLPEKRGSYEFDDEGTPSRRTVLIEKGVLKGYLYDILTAQKDKAMPSGHGRRESYHARPIPRMANTCVLPGNEDPQAIIRSVPKGLFVTRMGGGQVNCATGDFVFEVDEAFELTDGKIGRMVRGASLIGNGPEVLKSMSRIGSDLGFGIGTCGKDGQGVPVADAQPTLLIPKLTIGGTSQS